MPTTVSELIQSGLAMGLTVEQIIEAAQAHSRSAPGVGSTPRSAPQVGPPSVGSASGSEKVQLPLSPLAAVDTASRIRRIDRYDDLGLLGKGAMGEVRRVRDRQLGRTLAMKTIHVAALKRKDLLARFLEEAQATAQLQHPGIIPVYDMGILPDGRIWFTMKEVTGTTLSHVITEVHRVSEGTWQTTPSGWNLRRLMDALRQVCEAMGYAHSRGVVHRDLKPSNIMVGRHGEVMVLDWGLVKILGRHPELSIVPAGASVQTNRSAEQAYQTRTGLVAGTPAYMSPEQARGEIEAISPRSDVYALGAILYGTLSGRPPFTGTDAQLIIQQVKSGPPEPLGIDSIPAETFGFDMQYRASEGFRLPIPRALVDICNRAMARAAEDRFESAQEMALALQSWLDGARRQDTGRAIVQQAMSKGPEAEVIRARAAVLRAEAATLLADVRPWHPEETKLPGWRKEDEAIALEKQADIMTLEEELLLHGSLTHCPELPEAHAALARRYRAEHTEAEATRSDATRTEVLLRRHVAVLPQDHAERMQHLAYLKGDGALSLVTDPPGAEVLLYRYVLRDRRLVPQFERNLGKTPLHEVSMPMGSYLCVLRHPDRAEVNYPVCIRRQEHWHGIPPGGDTAHPIRLPAVGELGSHERYMPAGWFQCGGDQILDNGLPGRSVWVDERVFCRFPITNRRYLNYLNSLVASGKPEEALRNAPRERDPSVQDQGTLLYDFDGKRFSLRLETVSELSHLYAPVTMVTWQNAQAYARWEAERTGQPWRLPGELEWEKACRGVDGRIYPWGPSFDPSWACSRTSVQGPAQSLPVGRFPCDESVFGIRDLAGGVTDWCADPYWKGGPPLSTARTDDPTAAPFDPEHFLERVCRGASWFYSNPTRLRGTNRAGLTVSDRHRDIGFRLVRPYV